MADKDTVYQLTSAWSATNRYTASGDTDIILSNPGEETLYFARTTDNTAPSMSVAVAQPIGTDDYRAIQLLDGERIWFAGTGAIATLGV